MSNCERCGGETLSTTGSRFNTDMICPACEEREQSHPEYARAKSREEAAVRSGDFNFAGIGLPDELLPRRYAVSSALPTRPVSCTNCGDTLDPETGRCRDCDRENEESFDDEET